MDASLPPIACISWSSEVSHLLFLLTLDTSASSHFIVEFFFFFFDQNSFSNEQSINKIKNKIKTEYMILQKFSIMLLLLMFYVNKQY